MCRRRKTSRPACFRRFAEARSLAALIGRAIGKQAIKDGQAQVGGEAALERELQAKIWQPIYTA